MLERVLSRFSALGALFGVGAGQSAGKARVTRSRRAGSIGGAAAARQGIAEYDAGLLWSALLLLVIGLVMVYSSSIAMSEASRFTGGRTNYFLVRHFLFIVISLVAAMMVFQVPMRTWQQLAPWLCLAGCVALALVLIPGIGREVNGARRWLSLGFFTLQPSEFVKLAAVLYAADYTARKSALMHSFKRGLLPMLTVMLIVGWLLLREPDFGAFVVITSIAMSVLFLGGMNGKWFAGLLLLLGVGFAALVLTSPYRMQRIFGFMDPWSDPFGKGYQLSHALIAFGRGEIFGVGLGASVEKLMYLPEAHTDFLMAVIAEELGLIGVVLVVMLFAWLVWRAFAVGRQAVNLERPFSALVAQGVGVWIGVQSLINMGVNMGVLPTKGLTLPLMSFGGSGILANCVAIAILMRIDWENRQMMKGQPV
jgi:cell division protein FtsW